MSRMLFGTALSLTLLASGVATAAERTVSLAIDGMSCASCPYIVRTALQEVPGVVRAEVSYAEKRAVMTVDDAKATVAVQATAGVGFPSGVAE
jgi:periplasmic mercuric ion binding protein